MSDVPLVSIVTPSLNQAEFIAQTIDSVLGQNYPRIEYLVVDAGSADSTLSVLKGYGGRLRWSCEPGIGQAAAINRGWRASSGEFIAWLNSDDTYLPEAVSRAVAFLKAHPEIEGVYGDCAYVDLGGDWVRDFPARPFSYLNLIRSTTNYIPQPATFLRRRVLDTVGYLAESLEYVMDFDYWLRLGLRHQLAYMPVRLAKLRLHPGSKSALQIHRFAPELIAAYQRLFAASALPEPVRAVKAEAMSNVHYLAASCFFWTAQFPNARRHAFRALSYAPLNVRRPLLLALLGPLALRPLEHLFGNPFRFYAGPPDKLRPSTLP